MWNLSMYLLNENPDETRQDTASVCLQCTPVLQVFSCVHILVIMLIELFGTSIETGKCVAFNVSLRQSVCSPVMCCGRFRKSNHGIIFIFSSEPLKVASSNLIKVCIMTGGIYCTNFGHVIQFLAQFSSQKFYPRSALHRIYFISSKTFEVSSRHFVGSCMEDSVRVAYSLMVVYNMVHYILN